MKKLTIFDATPFLLSLWMMIFVAVYYFEKETTLTNYCLYSSLLFLILGMLNIVFRKIYSYSDMTQLQKDVTERKKQGEFVSLEVEEICDFAKIINIFWCEILYYLQKLRENSNILEAEKFTSLLFGTREYEIRELLLFQLKIKKININDIDADYELETKVRNEIRFIVRNFEDCRNEYFNVRYNKASR